MNNHSEDTRPFAGKSPEWLEEHGITLVDSDRALESWALCDEVLVSMLSEVVAKANEFLREPDIIRVTKDDVWVDDAGRRIDPAWHWLLDIVTLLAYESTTNIPSSELPCAVCHLPLQQMVDALQEPSRRVSVEGLKDILAFYTPGEVLP